MLKVLNSHNSSRNNLLIRRVYHYLYDNTNLYLARKKIDLMGLAKEGFLEK